VQRIGISPRRPQIGQIDRDLPRLKDGDDDWLRFQEIVAEAEENAGDEYEVLPHTNRMRDLPGWPAGRPVYDMATISLI